MYEFVIDDLRRFLGFFEEPTVLTGETVNGERMMTESMYGDGDSKEGCSNLFCFFFFLIKSNYYFPSFKFPLGYFNFGIYFLSFQVSAGALGHCLIIK